MRDLRRSTTMRSLPDLKIAKIERTFWPMSDYDRRRAFRLAAKSGILGMSAVKASVPGMEFLANGGNIMRSVQRRW